MKLPFQTPEQKQELLTKFKALRALDQKFAFWRNELGQEYVKYLYFGSLSSSPEYDELSSFRIKPNEGENKAYNATVLGDFMLVLKMVADKKGVQSIEEKLEVFNKLYEHTTSNRKEAIQTEIDKTLQEIESRSKPKQDQKDVTWDFFKDAFENYRFEGEETDLSRRPYSDLDNLIAAVQGTVYGQYLEFLEEELEKANQPLKSSTGHSLSQQLLIRHYEGFFDRISNKDNTVVARHLAAHFNKSYQNVRAALGNLHKLYYSQITEEKEKIRKDLETVLEYFTELGLEKEAKKVKAALAKLGL